MRLPALIWRYGAVLLIVQGLILIGAAMAARSAAQEAALDRAGPQMLSIASALTLAYDRPLATGAGLGERVRTDAQECNARLTLFDASGEVVADSARNATALAGESESPEVAEAMTSGRGIHVRSGGERGATMIYAAARGSSGLVVRAGRSLDDFAPRGGSFWQWSGIGGALLIGAAVLALLQARLHSTVSSLAAGVSRFVSGDFSHRIGPPEHAEFGPLVEAMNTTADQLGRYISELQSKRSENEAILRSMTGGVIALDLDQRVLHLNSAAEDMLAVRYAKARGRLLQEIVRLPELNKLVEDALEESDQRSDEFELHADKTSVVRANSTTLRDDRGKPAGVLIFLTDVTQLRRLESIRTDFAANVSHELRTPITNIKGYVETLLESDIKDPEQTRHFLTTVQRNADRLNSIIEDMLALTRLDRLDGKSDLTTGPTAIAEVIANAVAALSPEAERKAISLEARAPQDLKASINARLIEQAISNLVANAIQYSPSATRVTVRAWRASGQAGGGLVITVEDEGPGISPEHIPRLFERFYRVDKARSRRQGGTGLGLAIVKHIALVHGGRVEVESELGAGSTFRIVLPQA